MMCTWAKTWLIQSKFLEHAPSFTLKLCGKSPSSQEPLFWNSENNHPIQCYTVKEGPHSSSPPTLTGTRAVLMHQICAFIPRPQHLENLDPKSSWFISNIFLEKKLIISLCRQVRHDCISWLRLTTLSNLKLNWGSHKVADPGLQDWEGCWQPGDNRNDN